MAGAVSAAAPTPAGAITGAGATFPYPLYTKWIAEFTKEHPSVKINYQSIGSGGGIRQITERTVDFGASDVPMTEEQLKKAPGMLHIPTCLGAVVVTYKLQGVESGLKLTPDVVAKIFLGTIKEWNDPAIQTANPDVKLPKIKISSVHRSDGSGTTKLFTEWLTAVSPDWKKGPGAGMSVDFPSGLGAKGNEGVAGQVSSTPGSVGYVELVYAVQNKLSYAAIKNSAGTFVMPTPDSITASGASVVSKIPDDLRASTAEVSGENAYPIAGFTYILLNKKQENAERGKALVSFLKWSVHEGQSFARALSYAPLPAELVKRVDDKLATVTGPDDKPLLSSAKP